MNVHMNEMERMNENKEIKMLLGSRILQLCSGAWHKVQIHDGWGQKAAGKPARRTKLETQKDILLLLIGISTSWKWQRLFGADAILNLCICA